MRGTTTVQAAGQRADVPEIAIPADFAPKDARELPGVFFDRLAQVAEGTPEYQYACDPLIEMNMSLVRFAAARFRSRGPEARVQPAPADEDGESAPADFIGDEEVALGPVEDFHALAPMIAERLGVSQMHVSRLLARLREGLLPAA
ncbi:hypothetical protein ABZ770_24345 [Streptomyces sp. NPDC006654]|uniref:hypothetical protein n=1 Tax=unclassified Streptomyces TaxID=2593676 RepID=UPI0033E6E370